MPQSPPPKAPRRLVRDSEEDEEEKYVHDVLADDEAHAKAHAQPVRYTTPHTQAGGASHARSSGQLLLSRQWLEPKVFLR